MSSAFASLSNSMAEVVKRASQYVLLIPEGGRYGVSATIWKDDLAVCVAHTIRDEKQPGVMLTDGSPSMANLVGRDPTTDIALLRLSGGATKASPEFADSKQLAVGNLVLALGRRRSEGIVATHGMISAIGGPWRSWRGGRIDQALRLEVQPFAGFSGGPLIDAEGRVIGINLSGPRESVTTIPATTVSRVVDQLLAKGRVQRGFIGVGLQPVPLHERGGSRLKRGLLTVMVEADSPAQKAGLLVGDIVVALNGNPLSSPRDLQSVLDPEQIGKTFSLGILRGGKTEELSVLVGERGDNTAGES